MATLAALTAGCFQPMYAVARDGSPALRDKLLRIEVPPLNVPNASRNARVGVEIRNALMFKLYGSATGVPPTVHRLDDQTVSSTRSSLIVDPTTALPTIENYGIDANYQADRDRHRQGGADRQHLLARRHTTSPARPSASPAPAPCRDAEDRAAQEIAENIQTRLASFFYAGMCDLWSRCAAKRSTPFSPGRMRRARSSCCTAPTPAWCASAPTR